MPYNGLGDLIEDPQDNRYYNDDPIEGYRLWNSAIVVGVTRALATAFYFTNYLGNHGKSLVKPVPLKSPEQEDKKPVLVRETTPSNLEKNSVVLK